jgi:primosomal protein N' (replication factor Y)
MSKYVQVATKIPVDRTFQYAVTGRESHPPAEGKRVFMPFRGRKRVGYIVKLEDIPVVDSPRPLIDIIDEKPVFSGEMLELARWIKDNYYCSWGEALEAMIPGPMKKGRISMSSRIDEKDEPAVYSPPHVPNPEQQKVLDRISGCVERNENKVFLLHGITGSGKTEIYLQAMQDVLSRGRSGMILVPEIALTPQTEERFRSRFGEVVAVFHSNMLQSKRFNQWKRINEGKARIVVGPRSAVFSPFRDLGIIVVDEEHEPSYKQEDSPRYHARDVAVKRAQMNGIPVVLGSATPSMESYYKAVRGEYELVELTRRTDEKELPAVKIVDMRMDIDTRSGRKVLSGVMEEALRKDIKGKNQCLIFQNRRGFSTFLICRKCGYVVKCPTCDSPMVYHRQKKMIICHYCNKTAGPPDICPECKSDRIMYRGTGTQKVEEELGKVIPGAVIARMDSDTMSKRGAHRKVLRKFKEHEIDAIVGTQMIAKGLDFPKVTLVGVVSADANLNLPDFRSGERTFNLITQVAGRAGRGDLGGEVIVQTFTPDNYAISMAARHDFHGFYLREIESRRDLMFPPFSNLIKVTLRGKEEDGVIKIAEKLTRKLGEKMPGYDIIGPVPSPMARLRGYFRWNVIIRTSSREKAVRDLRKALKGFRKGSGIDLAVDVDPASM